MLRPTHYYNLQKLSSLSAIGNNCGIYQKRTIEVQ